MGDLDYIVILLAICGLGWCYSRFQAHCWSDDLKSFRRSAYASRLVHKDETPASLTRGIERYADPASIRTDVEEERECSISST